MFFLSLPPLLLLLHLSVLFGAAHAASGWTVEFHLTPTPGLMTSSTLYQTFTRANLDLANMDQSGTCPTSGNWQTLGLTSQLSLPASGAPWPAGPCNRYGIRAATMWTVPTTGNFFFFFLFKLN